MTPYAHRLDRLERHYGDRSSGHPARVPEWLRPWIDPLSMEDRELLEAGGFAEGADGDPATLSPEDRLRYGELVASYRRFWEERHQ